MKCNVVLSTRPVGVPYLIIGTHPLIKSLVRIFRGFGHRWSVGAEDEDEAEDHRLVRASPI